MYGNFRKCGTRFYPVGSGAVRHKVLVMAWFPAAVECVGKRQGISGNFPVVLHCECFYELEKDVKMIHW